MTENYANRFTLLIVQVYRDVRKAHVLRKSIMGSRGDETGSCKVCILVLVVLGLELGLEKEVSLFIEGDHRTRRRRGRPRWRREHGHIETRSMPTIADVDQLLRVLLLHTLQGHL